MASAFAGVIKNVIRELDRSGGLLPVENLGSSTSFQPYYLLIQKPSSSLFGKPRFACVHLSIKDILEPNAPEPAVERVGPFHFQDTVDGQLQGNVELATPGQGKLGCGATLSGTTSASMNVCTLRVSPNTWIAMQKERHLQKPEHKILQQLRHRGDNVYVVTEVLQTQKEVEVTYTRKREGSGQLALPGALYFQGGGQGHRSCKKTLTIPSGSILAFRVALLVIGSDWEIIFLPDKKQRTFGGGDQMPSSYKILKPFGFFSKCLLQSDAAHTENSLMLAQDFEDLQAEVEAQAEGLCILSPELCQQLLTGLGQVLRDEMTLHHLEELLEQGLCCGRVELQTGPVGDVLECLVQPCRMLEEELVEHFFYLLGALAELNEAQHMELAQMLEARAPLGPCSLVESLLEQSAPWQKPVPVSLPLGSSWGPEAPIWILLEECGLELKANAPHVRWVPEALDQTLALYACLALLSKLSQSQ
ncbi:gasdermin-D isoform X4 [Erinaceus europaeus]|uniref:Gasdermin-D isoform X4 n=1 Tax=Erinaceus europaeus TaxID=9365 RepID=A0A1S3W2K8_ERIEU|nr:gasdermin-D isoform X4 [Erinaceus europaeus]XP_016040631.2 gasdermin-D isoform X4 [Erinaceus europaeus]